MALLVKDNNMSSKSVDRQLTQQFQYGPNCLSCAVY